MRRLRAAPAALHALPRRDRHRRTPRPSFASYLFTCFLKRPDSSALRERAPADARDSGSLSLSLSLSALCVLERTRYPCANATGRHRRHVVLSLSLSLSLCLSVSLSLSLYLSLCLCLCLCLLKRTTIDATGRDRRHVVRRLRARRQLRGPGQPAIYDVDQDGTFSHAPRAQKEETSQRERERERERHTHRPPARVACARQAVSTTSSRRRTWPSPSSASSRLFFDTSGIPDTVFFGHGERRSPARVALRERERERERGRDERISPLFHVSLVVTQKYAPSPRTRRRTTCTWSWWCTHARKIRTRR